MLAFSTLMGAHADNVIIHTQASDNSYALKSVEEINFAENGINVVTTSETSAFPYDDVVRIDFVSSTTAISKTPVFASEGLSIANGVISNDGEEISVYTIDGRLMATGVSRVDVSNLPKGTYIVSSGRKTIKFVK